MGKVTCTFTFFFLMARGASATLPVAKDFLQMHSIIGENNLEEVSVALGSPLYEAAQAVTRMESKNNTFSCTAFRVGAKWMMTNFHCTEVESCSTIRFRSRYEKGIASQNQKIYQCEKLLAKYKQLDFAVYSVKEAIEDIPIATLTDRSLNAGAASFVASHPMGQTKKIDQSTNCVLKEVKEFLLYDRTNITHACDTLSGSSGSPVFDLESRLVVGIHWGGNSNQVGTFNHAIPMKRVLEYLSRKHPEIYSHLQIVH